MSSDTSPCEVFFQVFPPSRERNTPPISTPNQISPASALSNRMLVILVFADQIALRWQLDRHLVPRLAAVARTIEARRMRAGEHEVRIMRRLRDSVGREGIQRRLDVLPLLRRAVPAIHPAVGAREDAAAPCRLAGQRPDPRFHVQAGGRVRALPGLAAVLAHPHRRSHGSDIKTELHAIPRPWRYWPRPGDCVGP